MKIPGFLLIYLALGLKLTFGQDFASRVYTQNDGLPGSIIFGMHQDSEEFLWIRTESGLCKFDGIEFKTLTTTDGLGDSELLTMYEDSKGRRWFAGYNGTLTYLENGQFKVYCKDSPQSEPLHLGHIYHILEDSNRQLWVIGLESVYRINDNSYEAFECHYNHPRAALPHANGEILVLYEDAMVFLKNGKTIRVIGLPVNFSTNKGIVRYKNGYLIFFEREVRFYEQQGETLTQIKTFGIDHAIVDIEVGTDNSIWIATFDNGIYYYPDFEKDHTDFRNYLKGRSMIDLYLDKEGGIWAASDQKRLHYIGNRNALHFDIPGQLKPNSYYSIASDGSYPVYAGLDKALATISSTGEVSYSALPADLGRGYNRVKDIVTNAEQTWLGCDKGLILKDDKVFEEIHKIGGIKSISLSSNGQLLIATFEASFTMDTAPPYDFRRILNERSISICEGSNGEIWIGTLKGLYHYKPHWERAKKYEIAGHDPGGINCLAYSDNALWIGTRNNGLIVLKDDEALSWDMDRGLAGNTCRSIFIDENQRAWIATDKGVSCLAPIKTGEAPEIRNYDYSDGLSSIQVYDIFARNDSVWIASSQGIDLLLNDNISYPDHIPPVYINYARTGLSEENLKQGEELHHTQNSIAISFVGISYRSRAQVNYKYRLNGLHRDWQYTNSGRVEYASLPSGSYQFEVIAGDHFGNWSREPATFEFLIATPFWRTLWFKLVLAILFVALTILLVVRLIKNKTRKSLLQKKMAQLELDAVKAQFNPHFIFNCLSSIQYLLNHQENAVAQHYMTQFARLVRNTLEFSSRSFITLNDEIQYLENYISLERLRLSDRFEYEITVQKGLRADNIRLPPMLHQIYVENAVKHGFRPMKREGGFLRISFKQKEQKLLCVIEDNGIGRAASLSRFHNDHKSRGPSGMIINRQRIDTLNSIHDEEIELEIIDKDLNTHSETGTIVKLTIPQNL